jgi:N,N'-diacetyllegionaminate synthase
MEKLNIAGRLVGPGEPPYVIAEIGANHNGDMDLCHRILDAACAAGAAAVKFQSWSKASLFSRAEYGRRSGLKAQVEQYQLSAAQHHDIAAYCDQLGMVFFSSCFAPEEVDLLDELGVPLFKVASMDVNHLPLLEYVGSKRKPVLLSSGLATLGEIETALETLRRAGSGPVALLHCLSIYPSPPEVVDLENMSTLRRAFDVPVGYSDHSLGIAIPLGAVALGACVIEKHFTLDQGLPGWDHAISADPHELAALVQGAQSIFAALGSPVLTLRREQLEKRNAFRRRMVARRALHCGEVLTPSDVDFKRPGTGIRPDELAYATGRALARDIEAEEELCWTDFV